MFSDKLFDHKYDIDDIIHALLGDDHEGRWLLCTRDGTLIAECDTATAHITDGDDNNHWHEITPLPRSFLNELRTHKELNKLNKDDRLSISNKIEKFEKCADIWHACDGSREGDWLRERVKEVAMEWLDDKQMIPPSMRHVKDTTRLAGSGGRVTINITPPNKDN